MSYKHVQMAVSSKGGPHTPCTCTCPSTFLNELAMVLLTGTTQAAQLLSLWWQFSCVGPDTLRVPMVGRHDKLIL